VGERLYFEDSYLDGEVHFLKALDDYVTRVLCFPQESCGLLRDRLEALLRDGFIYLLETGASFMGMRILGKGYTGVVSIAYNRVKGLGAIKILRVDGRRSSLIREAEYMEKAYSTGLPPRLMSYRDFYVFYEYLPLYKCFGFEKLLVELLENNCLPELKQLILQALLKLYKLDLLRVDHTEINRPRGHMYVCGGDIKLLDWESARSSVRPGNVSSFVSYILFRFRRRDELINILGVRVEEALRALRKYKESYSGEDFQRIVSAILPQ
jgi:putative serine/threonine protein kinase